MFQPRPFLLIINYIFVFVLLFFFNGISQGKILPENLTPQDREFLLPYFSNSYAPQFSGRPYFLGHSKGLEVGVTGTYKPLSDLQDRFTSSDIDNGTFFTHLYIKKSLFKKFELSLSSNLSSFNSNQVSGFGGHLKWTPLGGLNYFFEPSLIVIVEFLNFEDLMTTQESSLQIAAGKNFKFFSVTSGVILSKISADFQGLANPGLTSSGDNESESIFTQHFFANLGFHFNSYNVNAVQSYSPQASWSQNLILSYDF